MDNDNNEKKSKKNIKLIIFFAIFWIVLSAISFALVYSPIFLFSIVGLLFIVNLILAIKYPDNIYIKSSLTGFLVVIIIGGVTLVIGFCTLLLYCGGMLLGY